MNESLHRKPAREALALRDVVVARRDGGQVAPETPLLAIDRFSLQAGARAVVTGPSGCGKTTLLHLLAGLERPAAGRVAWFGNDLYAMSEPARDRWRAAQVGMVFQEPSLFRELTALDNVLLPHWLQHAWAETPIRQRALRLLERVGIAPGARATALSRGEAQRVALVRACARQPQVLLADEPTASLDRANAVAVRDLLLEWSREAGITLVVATHDPAVADEFPLRYALRDGRLGPVDATQAVSSFDESPADP